MEGLGGAGSTGSNASDRMRCPLDEAESGIVIRR